MSAGGTPQFAPDLPKTWFFRPAGTLVGLVISLFGAVRSEGLENVPREGPIVVVANHYTYIDPFVGGYGSCWRAGRLVHMISKAEVRGWPVLGWLGAQAGVIYVRRGEADRDAQRQSLAVLRAGRALFLFPEGTRSKTGELIQARNGAALLAIRSGALVLPVAITGTEGMLSLGAIFGPRPRATVRIGQPFSLPHRPTGPIDRAELVDHSNRMMREIAALLPPSRRGVYG